MSVSPTRSGADVFDSRTFLKGLRSISLRNLSVRNPSAGVNGRGKAVNGQRDAASVTSASLPRLRAVILLDESGAGAAPAPKTEGSSITTPDAAAAAAAAAAASSAAGSESEQALLATGVSQPTVNPSWAISEMSWLDAGVGEQIVDNARTLLLRVYSVNPDNAEAVRYSPRLKPDPQQRSVAVDEGQLVWECSIDVRDLTAFPAGSRLSHLRILPADCLLVEMSNGGVYAPDWVIRALRAHDALPPAVKGSRGGSGADAWRDESDEDDDEDQEPLDEVLRKVLRLEEEAERGREELAACLKAKETEDARSFEAAQSTSASQRLMSDCQAQQELLQAEMASLEREKRLLGIETTAVEKLLEEISAAEEATELDVRAWESEQRETLKSLVLLEARRARLTAELQTIYPIKYQEKVEGYTIRGLELPADLYSIDDERVSSALGYTAHLVCMLAKYLQVPLRYQVIYNASRSAVRDNVTGAGVAYPLFRKGVEKERFDRGVYLLGRDVEQMLTSRGVHVIRGAGSLLRNLERLMGVEGI